MSNPADNETIVADLAPAAPEGAFQKLANNTLMLCSMLFLVTGVLGIPLIFMSTKLTWPQKILLTVAVTIYTAILVGLAYACVMWAWSVLSEL